MSRRNTWQLAIAILVVCVVAGFCLTIDRKGRRTYQMYVALDRKGPWGLTDPPWDGPDAVVLYRTGRHGVVCFDAFHSRDLHERLSLKNGQLATVEYDTFSDFGKIRAYNVHSVDGLLLADGYHVLPNQSGGVAGVLTLGPGEAGPDDCW